MKTKFAFILMLLIGFGFAFGSCDTKKEPEKAVTPAPKETPKPVDVVPPDALAKVGDRYIKVADYEKQMLRLSPKLADTEHGRKYAVNQVVDFLLIEKEAESRGLSKDPAIIAKIEDYTRSLYRNSLLRSLKQSQNPISDEEVKKYFTEHEDEFIQPEKMRLSVIEVPLDKEKDINAIYKELKAGKTFAQLAETRSKHLSAKRGGDIGFVTRKQYKTLTDPAFKMKEGEISKPFKTPSGWTILKVTAHVKRQDVSTQEAIRRARARMEAIQTSKSFETLMKTLREKNRVALYEDKIKQLQKQAPAQEPPAKKAP